MRADSTRFNISGRVLDETGEPLPGATVFISNSKWAASTDNKGMFKITEIPAGNYEVLVRMMGFSTFTKVFSITNRSVTINVTLNPDAIALSEAKIVAKPDGNRARYLKTFTEVFIGQSDNAKKSKILNSDVIRFQYIKATGTLTARSTDFIKVENAGLGYNIYYLLNSFAFNQRDQTFAYDGKIFFEELTGDEKKQTEWSKNRSLAYYGSMQHFFRALSAGTTDAEGFKVYKIADAELGQTPNYNSSGSARTGNIAINRINIDRSNLKPIKPDSLFKTVGFNKVLKIPLLVKNDDTTRFYVCYMNQREPTRFVSSGAHLNIPIQNGQVSRVFQLTDNIILNKNGTLNPQKNVLLEGFWGWHRVGDVLPEEFIPPAGVNTQKTLAKNTDLPMKQGPAEKIQADSTRFSFTGRVIDEKGEPMPGATIFITNTKWAASANSEGMFKLSGISPGTYEVLVRMMGFVTFTKAFSITDRSVTINVTLNQDAIALSEAKIVAKPDGNRARYLKIFTEAFIGQSDNGRKSRIINSDVIRFKNNEATNTLTARSTDLIKIENLGLGYNVYYLLNSSAINHQQISSSFAFDGKVFFEELKGDDKKQKEWSQNRSAAYYGSMRHFFKALYEGTTDAEGFKIYKLADSELGRPTKLNTREANAYIAGLMLNRVNINLASLKPVKPDSLYKVVNINKVLQLPILVKDGDTTRFYFCYTRKGEPSRFLNSGAHLNLPVPNAQISSLRQLGNDDVIINKNGTLTPQQNVINEGFWTWQRVGDVLPEEFIEQMQINKEPLAAYPLAQTGNVENIHIQMDRSWYLKGDTAWLKLYVVDANNRPSTDSKVCFIELIDANKRIIKNLRLPLNMGTAWGELALSDSLLKKGAYLLRAYTNNMLKNGNAFFYQTIRIADLNIATAKTRSATTKQLQTGSDSLTIRFFPEGGSLITDVNSRLALKATALGKPVSKIHGYITNGDGSHIAKFETNNNGISAFNLKPLNKGKYQAVIELANGGEKRFALPQSVQPGIGMAITQNEDKIVARFNTSNITTKTQLRLVGKANGQIQFQQEKQVELTGDSIVIPKSSLPQGILQFSLYTTNNILVADRMVYNGVNSRQLKVKVAANKATYKPHDKVDISIAVMDADSIPISGNFSVSVNNEADEPLVDHNSIYSDLLLNNKLIYDTGKSDTERYRELNDMLLTLRAQTDYKVSIPQQQATSPPSDTSAVLQGRVYTSKGKPAEPSVIGIYFPAGGPVLTTVSDNKGKFKFDNIPVKRGEPFYIVAKEKNGKELNVTVDKFTPPPITDEIMADTLMVSNANEYAEYVAKRIEDLKTGNILGTELSEVLIKDKKKTEPSVKDLVRRSSSSIGLTPDQVITFIDLLDCVAPTLGDCLAMKLNNVAVTTDNSGRKRLIARGRSTNPMAVFVNGIERPDALNTVAPSEIESIEVLKGANAAAYGLSSGNGVVVITTKKGGIDYWAYEQEHYVPGSTKTAPVKLYRFENGFDIAKDFYAPDYNAILGSIIDKWRPTIYWNPNVVTGSNGTAQLSYFTNGVPGTYRVTIEGIDDYGRIARQVFRYTVSE